MNFRTWFEEKVGGSCDRPFIYFEDRVYTYGQVDAMANRVANAFSAMGVTKGDKCSVLLNNCPEYIFLWFGLAKLGAVTACGNIHLRGDGLRYLINHSDSKIIVSDYDLREHIETIRAGLSKVEHIIWHGGAAGSAVEGQTLAELLATADDAPPPVLPTEPGDAMCLLHTGGTTGLPKWCILSQTYYMEIGKKMADFMGLINTDRIYDPLPLFHVNPQGYYVMGALAANASILITDRFSASKFWQFVKNYDINAIVLHRGVVDILKQRPAAEGITDHSVRVGYRLDADFMERFRIPMSINGYGSTEAGGLTNMNRYRLPLDSRAKKLNHLSDCTGKSRDDIAIKIVDENGAELLCGQAGEILVKALKPHVIFDGYYNAPEKTAESICDGWFRTGDIGYLDEENRLYFVQRKVESIRVRGEWIFVTEVEKVINSHNAVNECAIVGIKGSVGESEIKAVIELKAGQTVNPEEIIAYCEGKLAYFMIPRFVEFIDKLPRTEAGLRVPKVELQKTGVANAWDREKAGYKLKK
ncbi:MAG: AMP-binding protein [Deltaproteobacteria bacterium]|nr:AMP-binding protein [Deltaproteobacteria bacterium]